MATEKKRAPNRRSPAGRGTTAPVAAPLAAPTRRVRARDSNGSAAALARRGEKPETLVEYYRQMVLMRRFEERTGEMYTRAKIGGYCHLNLGEEATIVGLMAALTPDDYIFTNYREHGYVIARGVAPGAVMAELFGKETGVSKGRGG